MVKLNSMENFTIEISMVIGKNECKEKPKFEDKCHKCKKHGHKSSEYKTKILNPAEQIVKAIFGWDYNTWCKCHYYG